jgi:NAD(P)-dependent dehydrogenase (short-subunit alcohol dehydrogenase family)|uniref:Uncharacterized protein n=1 Tax=Phaeodactylum tricornutum TaxID=2850 RepID=A0A8J9TWR1_PHATR
MSFRALVVGGTSGIGHGIALALAKRGDVQVTIAGRSAARGHEIVEQMSALSPSQTHRFVSVDAFDLQSVRKLAIQNDPKDIDILVMTQGMATIQGYTPTRDGLDQKLQLHYFSRFFLASLFAKSMKPNSRIFTVLSAGVHGKFQHLEDDFELKNTYSIKNAADAAGFYLDAGMEAIANDCPSLAVAHAGPGFVNTNWGAEMPAWIRAPLRPLQRIFGKSAEDCGETMTMALLRLPTGYSLIDENGKTIENGIKHTRAERDAIVQKTMLLLPDV